MTEGASLNNDTAHNTLVQVNTLRKQARYTEAIAIAEAYLGKYPEAIEILCRCAESYYALGQLDVAEKKYQQALACAPDPDAYYGYAKIALSKGNFSEAEDILEAGLKDFPNTAAMYDMLTLAAALQEDFSEAEKRNTINLQKFPKGLEAPLSLARNTLLKGDIFEARKLYQQLLPVGGKSKARVALAVIALRMGKIDEAFEYYKEALSKDTARNNERDSAGTARNGLAQIAFLKGNYDDAIERYTKLMHALPYDQIAPAGLAMSLIKKDCNEEAEKILLEQHKRHPYNEVFPLLLAAVAVQSKDHALLSRAYTMLEKMQLNAQAESLLQKMETMGADQPDAQTTSVAQVTAPKFIEQAIGYANSHALYASVVGNVISGAPIHNIFAQQRGR